MDHGGRWTHRRESLPYRVPEGAAPTLERLQKPFPFPSPRLSTLDTRHSSLESHPSISSASLLRQQIAGPCSSRPAYSTEGLSECAASLLRLPSLGTEHAAALPSALPVPPRLLRCYCTDCSQYCCSSAAHATMLRPHRGEPTPARQNRLVDPYRNRKRRPCSWPGSLRPWTRSTLHSC